MAKENEGWLTKRLKDLGIRKNQFANMIKIRSQHMIWFEETKPKQTVSKLNEIAKILKYDPTQFALFWENKITEEGLNSGNLTKDVSKVLSNEQQTLSKVTEPAESDNFVTIDILDAVACCGNGVENFSENVIGQHMMTLTALRELTATAPENIKIIRAIGDSMTPTIRPGEMLWIDVSYTSPSSDGLYLIRIGKELLVRRIQLNPFDGSALIKADNEAYRAFPAEKFEDVPVLGRVIYHVVRMV